MFVCVLLASITAYAAFRVEVTGIAGFPAGGLTGQVLTKNSGTDFDSSWTNPKFVMLAADPGAPAEGQFYYNTVAHVLKFWNGTAWKTVTTN
jgi:hypothetical protein